MSLAALLDHAAIAPLTGVGWIKITGSDRVRWLNGMVTNSIAALKPGEGCYNFFLNAQGRIQGDATAWMMEDAILLETAAERIPELIAMLDRFIIMDDVELTKLDERAGLVLAGPNALMRLKQHGYTLTPTEALHLTEDRPRNLQFIHAYSPLVPTFELWSDPTTIAALLTEFELSIPAATPNDLEQLRILAGTPLCGTDIRDRDLPQETAQTRALHFAKGCYLGQEIVERIRSRGAVHRTFSGFRLTGELPPARTALMAEEKVVGELTSVASIELSSGPIQLALGYVRREALERGVKITYAGGEAVPASLPFRLE